ncbi:GNAT family N-acetyltransferase [Spirosoma utsteinense]|uniref:GNAT superfamily N-acetyltransferase n=1 Tax=Spirosoma utsteinense TaxID=2585773 RepID=A0ABR6W565_9BACT|nr:GNAT family N-acetyltransferase [Spirosoma utsteinense]MBC3788020.1 GNAT superfamily N-acetyltransferase [Spirosoma utsteinense]MBC3791278.1 GNAT superfamily N-acetyltransferase [Spirosoma utsteinense]
MNGDYTIDTDKTRLDVPLIQQFLSQESYWAQNVPLDVVERSIANSLCFGVYQGDNQVGFARVITDQATFAYLSDVFILPEHRGRGLSKQLIETISNWPSLQGLRRWVLATRDAHTLYEQFGFTALDKPEIFMQRKLIERY